MTKLRLEIDALRVESLGTETAGGEGRGTVRGAQDPVYTAPEYPTCGNTCGIHPQPFRGGHGQRPRPTEINCCI